MSIIVQKMGLDTVLLYFLQTALHVSDDILIHHQEHILNRNYNIWHWSNRICYHPLTSADGSKYGSTSARSSNYGLKCSHDDGWGYHPKHVELSEENTIKLYIVASCWTIIEKVSSWWSTSTSMSNSFVTPGNTFEGAFPSSSVTRPS